MALDELDTAIVAALQVDARRTNRDVAAAVGVSPTTALDRTRALRERGVLRGAILDVDLAALGRPVQALVAVRIRPPSRPVIEGFRAVGGRAARHPRGLRHLGDRGLPAARGRARQRGLYAFVVDTLTSPPEVADVRTSVVYEHLSNHQIAPVR